MYHRISSELFTLQIADRENCQSTPGAQAVNITALFVLSELLFYREVLGLNKRTGRKA